MNEGPASKRGLRLLIEPGFRSWDRQRREAQPFRSEVDGFLPRGRHRSAVLRGQVRPHSNDVRECKMTLKFHSRTPSLLQDLRLASGIFGLTAESGIDADKFISPRDSSETSAILP